MATIIIPMPDSNIKENLLDRYLDVSGIVNAAHKHELTDDEIYRFVFPYICTKLYKHLTAPMADARIRYFQGVCMWFAYMVSVPVQYVNDETKYVREVLHMARDYIRPYMGS